MEHTARPCESHSDLRCRKAASVAPASPSVGPRVMSPLTDSPAASARPRRTSISCGVHPDLDCSAVVFTWMSRSAHPPSAARREISSMTEALSTVCHSETSRAA
jgi:hypothetical protein